MCFKRCFDGDRFAYTVSIGLVTAQRRDNCRWPQSMCVSTFFTNLVSVCWSSSRSFVNVSLLVTDSGSLIFLLKSSILFWKNTIVNKNRFIQSTVVRFVRKPLFFVRSETRLFSDEIYCFFSKFWQYRIFCSNIIFFLSCCNILLYWYKRYSKVRGVIYVFFSWSFVILDLSCQLLGVDTLRFIGKRLTLNYK